MSHTKLNFWRGGGGAAGPEIDFLLASKKLGNMFSVKIMGGGYNNICNEWSQ